MSTEVTPAVVAGATTAGSDNQQLVNSLSTTSTEISHPEKSPHEDEERSSSKGNEENDKENPADEATEEVSDSNLTKVLEERAEEGNKTIDKKSVKGVSAINNALNNAQIELQPKIPIITVKKEPNKDDEDERNTSPAADSCVEKPNGDAASESAAIETKPKIGSLTVLGPSLLKSSVMNGSVSITPSNALDSPLNALTAMTEASNSGPPSGGFVDAQSSSEYISLDRLAASGTRITARGETCDVCGETTPDAMSMETHRMSQRHYKCNVSPICNTILFDTRQELNGHRTSAHRLPPTTAPSADQTTSQNSQLYGDTVVSPKPQQQGTIVPRSFASLAAPQPQQSTVDPVNGTSNRAVVIKRLQPQSPGGPTAKGRRLDVLLPDSHEDVDCQVMAIQQRNNSSGLQIQTIQSGAAPVQLRPGSSVSITTAPPKEDANSVANILATRGITVTPAGSNRSQPQSPQSSTSRQPSVPAPITLNSAISILPATNQTRQERGFAVPQGRVRMPNQPIVNLPTVDLTQDSPRQSQQHNASFQNRGRPSRVSRFTCQVCDKGFPSREALSSHMASHSSPGKLPYRCNLCNAQYPTQQGLAQHKQTFHKESSAGSEMALPVVDLKQPGVGERLASLGVRHFVPLSQLQSQSGGLFGVPIIAIDSARNSAQANLGALGASNILSLGPLKTVAHR